MTPIKILVVDDSVVARMVISKALDKDPDIDVVDTATNGKIALRKIPNYDLDLVLLDIEMPEMDGLETLAVIKEKHPSLRVIMFSSLTERGSNIVLEALNLGADDCVAKPTSISSSDGVIEELRSTLAPKIKALCNRAETNQKIHTSYTPRIKFAPNKIYEVLAIGVSTGGPKALAALLPTLPASFPIPIVIVQHMPPVFTKSLAERLDKDSALSIREAQQGDKLTAGQALLAPGGYHMVLQRMGSDVYVRLNQDPPEEGCRPAVDVLFRSVNKIYGDKTLAVILTGMGKDGLAGSKKIVASGGTLLAQDEATSVVWGMPGAVARANLASQILPPSALGPEIIKHVNQATVFR